MHDDRVSAQHIERWPGILAFVTPHAGRSELRMKMVLRFNHADAIDVLAIVPLDWDMLPWNRKRIDIAIDADGDAR